jgi:hypothetical protein
LSSLTLCFPIGFHFLAYPNLFGIKGFVVVVVVVVLFGNFKEVDGVGCKKFALLCKYGKFV